MKQELELKKQDLKSTKKSNLANVMKLHTKLDLVTKQVNYWKRLQLNSAVEVQAETVVADALVKEPVVIQKTGLTAAFGLGKKIKQKQQQPEIPPEFMPKVYTHTYMKTYDLIYIYIYIYMYDLMHTYVHTYIHTYIHIHSQYPLVF
jgi:hypothetical protein